MNGIIDSSINKLDAKRKRSNLLSGLCILTWIGSVWYFISAIYGVFTLETTLKAIRSLYALVETSSFLPNYLPDYVKELMRKLDNYMLFSRIHQVVTILNSVVCFLGAIFMWRNKKMGYFLYLFSQLTYFVSCLLVYVYSSGIPLIGAFNGIFTMFSMLMVVIFIILYSVRLRNLT